MTTTTTESDIDKSLLEKQNRPKSVLEMKRQLTGSVTGYGKLIGFSEQYVVVSRTKAECSGNIRCACDASPVEHTRPCSYSADIKHNPPVPIVISVFDTGNGKSLVCPRCKGIDFEVMMEQRTARLLILDDVHNPNANVRQQVIVYDNMVENLTPGELVQVEGEMHVERKAGSNKNSKMDNVLHATSIKYLKKKEVVVTECDIKNFYNWKKVSQKEYAKELKLINQYEEWSKQFQCEECAKYARRIVPMTFVDRLVAAFAPNVVGHKVPKRGLLRSIVGAVPRGPGRLSGKIHTLMVGEKGTAKSKLGEETRSIKLNSGHVSGTHASTKTITAVVDPDTKTLMLGVIPLSSLVVIDEVDKIPREEQARLLDVLEEQHFNKDAYGYHYEVTAPTSIIATSNPVNPNWLDSNKIATHEINILDTLRDRFPQVYIFRDDNTTEEKRNAFALEMNAIRKRPVPNYTFLRKFLVYASTIKPEYSLESERMLCKFWAQQNAGGLMNNRFYNAIFKIAEAEAKLQLCNEIDEEIAAETMESVRIMLLQYAENVRVIAKPSELVLRKFLDILENTKAGVVINELCRIACKEDPQISAYLGKNWTLENNWKLRPVVKSLRKHPQIKQTSSNPLVFQWFADLSQCDQSDASDAYDTTLVEVDTGKANCIVNGSSITAETDRCTSEASGPSGMNQSVGRDLFGKPPSRPKSYVKSDKSDCQP
jgi:hypothetical protein